MLLDSPMKNIKCLEPDHPFVNDPRSLELWSRDFFVSVTRDRLRIDP